MGLLSYFFNVDGRQKIFDFLVLRVRWISAILFTAGITWLLVLPNDEFNIPTRISESALLPGQVQTHFGGSDYMVLNAFRNEIRLWDALGEEERLSGIESIFHNAGIKCARQSYNVSVGGRQHRGTNIYGLLEAPRGDATEALVLNAAWKNAQGVVNEGGVTQLLALARYFRRWSLWSKDILFVVPADRDFGSQAWIDAYHDNHDKNYIQSLSLTSGAIQAGVDLDWYGQSNRYNYINVRYEGSNGQLANLDLVNSAIHIAKHQLGIMAYIQGVANDDYKSRLSIMLKALSTQAHGLPSGSHSPYIPYKIDTISIVVTGQDDGYHDDSSLGRILESFFRSLNNILEHLHASFFFYILVTTHRFVSIGNYLPSAMLIAICYTITGISRYIKHFSKAPAIDPVPTSLAADSKLELLQTPAMFATVAVAKQFQARRILRPITIVVVAHALGLCLFHVARLAATARSPYALTVFMGFEYCLSFMGPSLISRNLNGDDIVLLSSFSQIMLGMFLSAIATINFPLALAIGMIAFPTCFIGPAQTKLTQIVTRVTLLIFTSPMSVLYLYCTFAGADWRIVIVDFVFGYEWQHVWTPIVIFGVWWPVYFLSSIVVSG